METTGSNRAKDILNEVWDRLPQAYFERHRDDAAADFLRIYDEVKKEREEKNNG